MSGGGKTQTSTSTVQIPPEVLARYNAVNTRAEGVAATPFQAYSYDPSAFVAPMTETQNQAIGQIGQASGMAQPYFQTGAAATLGGMGPANLGELDTSKYMSPYLQNVVQSTADILGQQNRQDMSGALGTAIQSGAGFGDRSGIAAANLNRQQMMGMGSTIGNLLNQGYQQAQGVAQQQQSADLAARQANLARLLQGGQSIGQLGAGAQGAALAGSQALLGAGTQQQQTEQAGKSALYNQFLQERAYPFQVSQFLGNLAMGTGALSGSTTQTTSPAGFFSGFKDGGKVVEGVSYRRGGLVPESMGGHVNAEHMGEGYADGGASQMDYAAMVMQQLFGGTDPSAGAYGLDKIGLGAGSYIPKGDLPVGQLMIANPVQGPKQTSASDLVDMASSLADTGEKAGDLWDEYGPKSSGGRTGLAAGGIPYDPSGTGYVPVQEPGTQKTPELLQPKEPQQPESGLSKVADIAKIVGMFMANGGVAGRHGYATDGAVDQNLDPMDAIRRKALEAAKFSFAPGNQNLPPDLKGASYDPGRQNLPPEIVPVPTAEDSFRRNLETAAPAGAAVEQPAGLSAADANRIRQQFYTDYYAKQPVQQIKNDERLAPGLAPPAAGNVLGGGVNFNQFGEQPMPVDPLFGGVSPAAAQMDLTPQPEPTPAAGTPLAAPIPRAREDRPTLSGLASGVKPLSFPIDGAAAAATSSELQPGLAPVVQPPVAAKDVDAASVIRSFEGFSPEPYWDVNHHRVGYGSDTITRADGTFESVVPGMSISREDAERDLSRRIANFQAGISEKIGAPLWQGLPSGTQAALTSIAYNYGSLPDSVAEAVKSGDQEKIAIAIEALGSHNDGVNRARRNKEAALVRGVEMNDPSGGGALAGARVGSSGAASSGGGNAQPAPGLGGPNFLDQAIAKAGGAENIVLPFLAGLGKMAGSQSRFLGTAMLEGIGGGAEAYMNRQKQLADIAQTQSLTRGQDITNVRNSIQSTDRGDIVWTSQNGVPVPVLFGAYQGMLNSGQVIAPLGFVPTNATTALNDYFKKIGIPQIETGAPKIGEETEKTGADLKIPAPTMDILNRDMQTLMTAPSTYRESQKKMSDQIEESVVAAGNNAMQQGTFLNQITHQLMSLPETGILSGGPLAEMQKNALALYNQAIGLFGEQGAKLRILPEEIGTQYAADKLAAAGVLAQNSSVGAGTVSAIQLAELSIPNKEIPVEGARKILAGLYVDKTMSLDRWDALNKAKDYVASVSPAMPENYLAQNIVRDFGAQTASDYANAKLKMEKILSNYYALPDGQKIPVVDLVMQGVMTPAEFDKAYGAGMSRYILNMVR